MNLFRCTPDRSLDRKYLRVCAVYKLLKRKRIGQAEALKRLAERHNAAEMQILQRTVEIWRSHPIKDMLP